MKRFMLAAVLVAMAVPLYGQGVMERVELPTAEREQMYWSTLVTDSSEASRHLRAMFVSDPTLVKLLKDTRTNDYRPDDVYYVSKLKSQIGNAPLFLLQDPDGGVVYKCTANTIPSNSKILVAGIQRELKRRCRPKPDPAPTPPPDVTPDEPLIPDTEPVEPEESDGKPLWMNALLIALFGATGAGARYYTRK